MNLRSSSSRRRLAAVLTVLGVAALGAGAALGASDAPSKPPRRPLAQAVLAALSAPPVEGVSARVHLSNHLLPPGSLPKGTTLPFGASADGRIWLARDGRLRLDVQSDAGDAEISYDGSRVTVYDAGSKTIFRAPLALPAATGGGAGSALGSLATQLAPLMRVLDVSEAVPSNTAGRPTYTVRVTPKDDGGLLGAAELAFDADHGIPLRAAVYQHGEDRPVLELAATDVEYGPVADAEIAPRPHPDAKVVDVARGRPAAPAASLASGVDAVRRRAGFPLAAPATVAGLPRRSVHLLRSGRSSGALVVYGRGLGTVLVFETKVNGAGTPMGGLKLPEVNVDGRTGTELATALGTVLTFERDGVRYTLAGLVPPVAVENAARSLR
jgi:outer membrane lipoprotein-sorting protein